MARQPGRDQTVVKKEDLGEVWEEVGSGGFGTVYKVRYKKMGEDVAVKVLYKEYRSIFKEANLMDRSSFKYVLSVYAMYTSPLGEKGLIMDYMKRGSIETLREKLSGPPPWPLAFRLAHQTALAMNFIHGKDIVHRDLKPNNILLDDDLNAKVADFGLSSITHSAVTHSDDSSTGPQGTFKYMPPEAFESSYEPKRSFDVYSFGILLWAIFTGEEPYPAACYALVKLNRRKDRPPCEKLLRLEVNGITELVDLIKKCWENEPSDRPKFHKEDKKPDFNKQSEKPDVEAIFETTEELFSRHSSGIQWAVPEVWRKLDSSSLATESSNETLAQLNYSMDGRFMEWNQVSSAASSRKTKNSDKKGLDVMDFKQASSAASSKKTLTREEKAKFINRHRPEIIKRVTHALAIADDLRNMVHSETYSIIRVKKVPQHQNRELCDEILKKSKKVTEAFYDALKIHEADLMEELEEEDAMAGLQ